MENKQISEENTVAIHKDIKLLDQDLKTEKEKIEGLNELVDKNQQDGEAKIAEVNQALTKH